MVVGLDMTTEPEPEIVVEPELDPDPVLESEPESEHDCSEESELVLDSPPEELELDLDLALEP